MIFKSPSLELRSTLKDLDKTLCAVEVLVYEGSACGTLEDSFALNWQIVQRQQALLRVCTLAGID